jgi:hypothetical protein
MSQGFRSAIRSFMLSFGDMSKRFRPFIRSANDSHDMSQGFRSVIRSFELSFGDMSQRFRSFIRSVMTCLRDLGQPSGHSC